MLWAAKTMGSSPWVVSKLFLSLFILSVVSKLNIEHCQLTNHTYFEAYGFGQLAQPGNHALGLGAQVALRDLAVVLGERVKDLDTGVGKLFD